MRGMCRAPRWAELEHPDVGWAVTERPSVFIIVLFLTIDAFMDLSRTETGLLESAVEQATDAVVITEGAPLEQPGPRITYVNQAFTEMTGYGAEEVVGQTPRILQGPATQSRVLDRLRRRLEEGNSFDGEAINYRKDGTPFVNEWSISPITNEDDEITHWLWIQRDVTEEREINKRLFEGQEKERRNLAQELHDEIGGFLTSLQMLVDRTRATVRNGETPNALFSEVEEQIETMSKVVRKLTGRFSSRVLRDFGLSEAVSRLASKWAGDDRITVDLHNELEPDERLCPLLEHLMYRVVRTSLKHSAQEGEADATQILLNKTSQELRLHIIDNTDTVRARSTGDPATNELPRIRKQIEQLNGTLTVHAAPDARTRLTVTVPRTHVSLGK